ncbi:putative secreted protein (Por secretion system target) [Tenacibaculum skagerrakense]|uniref:Putative secreted protein (Por secretion system target) n=1 Tax=Tenacibaculum skagerrakense TaxID=186571 RepID=A0A4V2SLI6_9FLAO|nr:GEVED domain-containing protein [Tenacibaculum skagerrakense]TCP23546.1 putative secreted protein (Por secretion system target) [Tenacibaculum skagerrakense]
MNYTIKKLFYFFAFSIAITVYGQNDTSNKTQKSIWKGTLDYRFVPSIKEQIKNKTFIPASLNKENFYGKDKRTKGNNVVPGKGLPKGLDPLLSSQKSSIGKRIKSTSLTFETTNSAATPSDPTGAVGRDYYIASWNTAFRIFNKDGSPATPAASLTTLFPGTPNGDPIVLYDSQADRYIVTEFENNPNGFHVAISQTNDPVNGGWHVYSANGFQTGTFPDYTKFSIWSDGYYVTANISATDTNGNTRNGQVWALERDKMLVGDISASIQAFSLTGIETNGFYSPQAFNVTDGNLPARGNATIVYMQDDAWSNVNSDHLKLWTINVDWSNSSNSTISAPIQISTSPFTSVFDGGGFSNLPQPTGPNIDAMQATIMNQAQFRKFATHNSVVFNFVVNTDPTNKLAGIRWYELRQAGDGQPWSIYQEGTYVAPEGRHAFGASMAMDGEGNIGMGYSSVSATQSISLRYSGRFKDDPLNTMTALEELIVQSNSDNPNTRYADYSHLTVDPSNDADFWFVSEYFNNGARSNMVGVFQLTAPPNNDVGITSFINPSSGVLSDSEDITVTIRNFGTEDQTNFPVSYTINGGTVVTETFTSILGQGQTVEFTFTAKANLSISNQVYSIEAYTGLSGDENVSNNSTSIEVINALDSCTPTALEGCGLDGIKRFVLGTIDIDDGNDGCNSTGSIRGYVDRRNLSTDLDRSLSTPYTLRARHNWTDNPTGESLSAWIDFNDNGTFEVSEQLINGVSFTQAGRLDNFDLNIPSTAPLGNHILRVKAIDATAGGDINDPCSDFDYGEVHDYSVKIIDSTLSTNDYILENSEIKLFTQANNHFKIELKTDYQEMINFRVFDILGKQIVFNNISKKGDRYEYALDMSYAAPGVYVVKMGSFTKYKSVKLVVK